MKKNNMSNVNMKILNARYNFIQYTPSHVRLVDSTKLLLIKYLSYDDNIKCIIYQNYNRRNLVELVPKY